MTAATLGAFVAGILVSESDVAHQAAGEVIPFRDLFAVLFLVTRRRRARAEATHRAMTTDQLTRRAFFRRSLVASLGVFAAQFGGGTLAFMWPSLRGSFGSVFSVGKLDSIKSRAAPRS